ncbi:MAG: LuxR family transcriptional regulator [Roseovarius sp.]|nr:LuxR family transcriptional regulator [Roseovarius sp.]
MTLAPQMRLDCLLSTLESASEPADLQHIIEGLRDYFRIDHMVYHWVSAAGDQYGCGTYDPAWVQLYLKKDYLRIDPVVQGCYQRFHPVDWKRLDWTSKPAREFQQDAIKHGVGNQGYSVPVRGPNGQFALFTVSHNCTDAEWEEFIRDNRRNMVLIAHEFNRRALDFEPDRAPEPAQSLSPREIDAMALLAMGYSRAQVAETLSISEHTLRVYIEGARMKLGATNTVHAVAKAISRGLVRI